jgi:LPS export ABC transporter protein LptC
MCRRANYLLFLLPIAGLAGASLLSACTNDLKKIQEISQKVVNSPADTTRGVDIIYSDSAIVKAHLFAPLMLEYGTDTDTSKMVLPKGVKIIIYDNHQQEQGTIIADTAYYMQTKQLIKLRKNVVITSAKGDVFQSDELDWDQFHKKITSTKPVDITKANGDKGHGTGLETNESLNPINIDNLTGNVYMNSDFGK